ncbi:MAG: hypothetical protein Salg2KO_21340 [Salibacteraceae bacterium]
MDLFYLGLFFITLIGFSALLNFLLLRWTRTLGRKNDVSQKEIRWSDEYKPAIGGISFFMVFIISLLAYFVLVDPDLEKPEVIRQIGIMFCVTLGFFAGLADDAFNTVPWLKFAAQFFSGAILVVFGLTINFFEVHWMDALLTIFWTISVMNSINMLDNMDGVSASVSIFILACAAICAFPITESNLFFTLICGGTTAALIGFLFFNFNPARMFMGDTGSQMLGALLAAVGIVFFWNNDAILTDHSWYSKIAIVMTAFVVPIGDSLTVTINRLLRGQSPFVGGKDHTTHHLSYAGLSEKQVSLVMIAFSAISLLLITGLKFIPNLKLSVYVSILFVYSISSIGFLYSTTVWKKSRTVYQASQSS